MKPHFEYDYPSIFYSYDDYDLLGKNFGIVTRSELEIVAEHYEQWSKKLISLGKNPDDYSYKDCVEDWVITNWAWRV